ncbi:gamma-glutamylcyclotransferase [Lautropia dentalis]|uniref:Gamma-glutamylcyclotransferase n=1 Tax=Lautropia dentalis TaxID=2490857 RepID=A0A426FNX2_9BURK|nr:gamma-glutamylcyclotransferase family protein [Lautropia dentalis]RRN44368.1 gamma-glutamylcyclotransferase [Lautropia dentalis]
MQKLFSYGTLQQENVQLATFSRKLTGSPDVLVGYRLDEIAISDPAVVATSGKTHHPMLIRTENPADEVPGVIFEITDEELAQADRYEVKEYARVMATFRSGAQAWIYGDAREAKGQG